MKIKYQQILYEKTENENRLNILMKDIERINEELQMTIKSNNELQDIKIKSNEKLQKLENYIIELEMKLNQSIQKEQG